MKNGRGIGQWLIPWLCVGGMGICFAGERGAGKDDSPIVRIEVETGNPIHVLKTGEEAQLALSIENASDERRRFALKATLEDFDGQEIALPERSFDLAARERAEWRLDAPPKLGIWWVNCVLTPSDPPGNPESIQRSFAYMKPAGPTSGPRSGFRFGMSGWFATGPESERNAQAIALCGVDICRFGGIWQGAAPREGQWNWDRADQIIGLFEKYNIEPQWMLSYTPSWAALPIPQSIQERIDAGELLPIKSDHAKPPRPDSWRQFVAEAGRRYQGRVRYWEVWNEPDWRFFYGSADQYLEMLKIAHEELKRIDSNNLVITGGFAVAGSEPPKNRPNPQMQEIVLRDGQEHFDLHGHHEHGPFEKFMRQIDGIVMPMREQHLKTFKPLYFTETGCAVHYGFQDGAGAARTEQEQAANLVRKLVFSWSRGAVAYNWFTIHDIGDGDYGMFHGAFYPKPVYPAYNTLVWMLRGKTFERQMDLSPKRWAFLFFDEEEQVIVAWDQPDEAAQSDLIVETDAAEAQIVDMMGNRSPAPIANGQIRMPASIMPRFLVLRGAATSPAVSVE